MPKLVAQSYTQPNNSNGFQALASPVPFVVIPGDSFLVLPATISYGFGGKENCLDGWQVRVARKIPNGPELATESGLFLFLVVGKNPADEEDTNRDDHDGDNDAHRRSHLFN